MASKKNKKRDADDGRTMVCRNPKVRHDYHVLDTLEAGMVLVGSEVKALRNGKGVIREAFARVENGEVYLLNMHIGAYDPAAQGNHEPLRKRKLLLHRREIERLIGKSRERGLTLVPLAVYFREGHAKVEIALVRGKRQYDRREDVKKREMQREAEQAMRRRR